jgi:hypothetical protein
VSNELGRTECAGKGNRAVRARDAYRPIAAQWLRAADNVAVGYPLLMMALCQQGRTQPIART